MYVVVNSTNDMKSCGKQRIQQNVAHS